MSNCKCNDSIQSCNIHNFCDCGEVKQIISSKCRKCWLNIQCVKCREFKKKSEFIKSGNEYRCCKDCSTLYDHCECGYRKSTLSKQCEICREHTRVNKIILNNDPIKNYLHKNNKNPSHYTKIRQNARKLCELFGLLDSGCNCCDFSFCVQVCHIKPIKCFPEDTPINVVNNLDNLAILCPNCHWLLDHGYPSIDLINEYYIGCSN